MVRFLEDYTLGNINKAKRNWEEKKENLTDEQIYLANLIERAVAKKYKEGEIIRRNVVREVINETDFTTELHPLIDYLVDKYRR